MALEETSEYLLKGLPIHQLKKDESYSGVKVYRALLTQSGTDAPVATVLENTLGGTVVWTYSNSGIYTATLAGAFRAGKTVCLTGGAYFVLGNFHLSAARVSDNAIILSTFLPAVGLAADNWSGGSIDIMVYP